jgi:hypothetical protein
VQQKNAKLTRKIATEEGSNPIVEAVRESTHPSTEI